MPFSPIVRSKGSREHGAAVSVGETEALAAGAGKAPGTDAAAPPAVNAVWPASAVDAGRDEEQKGG